MYFLKVYRSLNFVLHFRCRLPQRQKSTTTSPLDRHGNHNVNGHMIPWQGCLGIIHLTEVEEHDQVVDNEVFRGVLLMREEEISGRAQGVTKEKMTGPVFRIVSI